MISAKLIKNLEKEGFMLDFPQYSSNEAIIKEILKEKNQRLYLAIPLLLRYGFDYNKIKSSELDKIIIITNKIFNLEKIDNTYLKKIIKENKIKEKITKSEFDYYYLSFKDSLERSNTIKEESLKDQIDIRSKLNLNRSLSTIYSPGKIRIMDKIFKHEKITNSELKYYYRSIRPLILAINNENLQKYLRIIESTKKYVI